MTRAKQFTPEQERLATDAFAVHAGLLKAERDTPDLRSNPQWLILRQDAYERFSLAFQASK